MIAWRRRYFHDRAIKIPSKATLVDAFIQFLLLHANVLRSRAKKLEIGGDQWEGDVRLSVWNPNLSPRLAGIAAPMSGRCWNRRGRERAGRNPRGGTLNPVKLLRAGSATKRTATLTKLFSWFGEDTRKRTGALMRFGQTSGCDHVGTHS
jgi:hypothetical protein